VSCLVVFGGNGLEDLAPGADEADVLVQLLLQTALVVHAVAVTAQHHLQTKRIGTTFLFFF
jgi:hypothetical protein